MLVKRKIRNWIHLERKNFLSFHGKNHNKKHDEHDEQTKQQK